MVGHCTCAEYLVHTMPFLQGLTGVIYRLRAVRDEATCLQPYSKGPAVRAEQGHGEPDLEVVAGRMVGSLHALGSRPLTRGPLGFLTGIGGLRTNWSQWSH